MKIGIGISTTPNRDVLKITLPEWIKYMPRNTIKLEIECDEKYEGVAKTKNKLLAKLDDCEHIFLVDDDVKPLMYNWHHPYVFSPEPHLMYQFKLPNKPKSDMQEVYRDNYHVAYTHTRGAFIYLERRVLDVIGGFDEGYDFGYEHADLTNRIHNAGLTSHRAMDVVDSHELLYCYDQDGAIESSASDQRRKHNMIADRMRYRHSRTSKDYMRYK